MAVAPLNFNRIIDITLVGDGVPNMILTPISGRKPEISLSALLLASDFAGQFEVRYTNLYASVNLSEYSEVIIRAGYRNGTSICIQGSINIAYTENPGPDRVTVIQGVASRLLPMLNVPLTVDFPFGGYSLSVLLSQVSTALGFLPPQVDAAVAGLTCPVPFAFNGIAKDIFPMIKDRFPGVTITVSNNTISAWKDVMTTAPPKIIKYLHTTPTYTGGKVVLTAPFDPGISVGDVIYVPNTGLGVKDITASSSGVSSRYTVYSIQIEFSTTENKNSMIITGASKGV